MAYGIRPQSFAVAFWRALAGAIVILLLLAILNQRLSTGWRMFVLARGLRAIWAASIAMMVGIGAGLLLETIMPRRGARFSKRRMLVATLKSAVVMLTVLGTLGYFMPDWTPFSAFFAMLTLSIWLLTGAVALTVER
jgi:hypothetical protein